MHSVSETIARALLPLTGETFGLMGNGNAYFVDALERLGRPMTPVRHEAAAVANRSGCMSRQVGAAVVDAKGDLISVGWNDGSSRIAAYALV